MATSSSVPPPKRASARSQRSPVLTFEIVEEHASPASEIWSRLRVKIGPLVEAGRHFLGHAYASAAQAVLEQKEDFEDRRAEKLALQRAEARKNSGKKTAASTPLLQAGPHLGKRPSSRKKARA